MPRINWSGLDKQRHPDEMWKLLDDGFTLGVFQIEDGYGKQLCKQFKPRSVEDLGIIVALNRPGPIRSGAPDRFIARRKGEEPVNYDHPILEDVLDKTYGLFIYQEQVMRFMNKLGYDLSQTDDVRKILGKKKPEDMQALKHGEGEWTGIGYFTMADKAGLDRATAELIWNKIENFAAYSFNKAHAISYAIIAFRTLYIKYLSHRLQIIASIRTIGDDPDKAKKTAGFIGEGRRAGIEVLPPEILKSDVDMGVCDDDIYFGFVNVKGVGVGAARYLIRLRDRYDISTPELLDAAIETEDEVWQQKRDYAKANGLKFAEKSPRQTLRSNQIAALYEVGAWDEYDDERRTSLPQKQKAEKDLLGVILTDDCLETFSENYDEIEQCDEYYEAEQCEAGNYLTLPGAIASIVPKTTKTGKKMGIVTIEFEGDGMEFAVFPQDWTAYRFLWKERTAGIFTLKCGSRGWSFDSGKKL